MLHGHYWTLRRHLEALLRPAPLPPSAAWFASARDPVLGAVRLSGRLRHQPGSEAIIVVVHGLGGSSHSPYTHRAAGAAERAGVSCLRLNLRGADLLGEDLFHAGLASDLDVALQSPELRAYERVHLFGYSLGGHICLRYAAHATDPRLVSVAALCSPIDLAATAAAFDDARLSVYRGHILKGLKQMYVAARARGRTRTRASLEHVLAIRKIRHWDEAVVAPRHGFANATDYYREMSAGPVLSRIQTPTLLVHAKRDPIVPIETVRPWTAATRPPLLVVESDTGGHVGFQAEFSLGQRGRSGVEEQVTSWLLSASTT
jgi:hypothetical protein